MTSISTAVKNAVGYRYAAYVDEVLDHLHVPTNRDVRPEDVAQAVRDAGYDASLDYTLLDRAAAAINEVKSNGQPQSQPESQPETLQFPPDPAEEEVSVVDTLREFARQKGADMRAVDAVLTEAGLVFNRDRAAAIIADYAIQRGVPGPEVRALLQSVDLIDPDPEPEPRTEGSRGVTEVAQELLEEFRQFKSDVSVRIEALTNFARRHGYGG